MKKKMMTLSRFCVLFSLVGVFYTFCSAQLLPRPSFNRNRQSNLAAILRSRGYNAFYVAMKTEKLYSALYDNTEYTIFVPINSNFQNDTNIEEIRNLNRNIGCYVFDGKFNVNKLKDGMILIGTNNCKVFVNKLYDFVLKKVIIWIQGIEISEELKLSGNSIIHLVDGYLKTPNQLLLQYLEHSGNHHVIHRLMKKQSIYFQFSFGTTFFAPLDTAFTKVPSVYLNRLFSNDTAARIRRKKKPFWQEECQSIDDLKEESFLRSHAISRAMCRQRLFHKIGWSRVINDLGRSIQLFQDTYNKQASYVNGAALLTTTSLTNGWVYGITEVILPDIHLKVLETLSSLGCHTFLHHLIATDHMHPFSTVLQVHTLFAPSDAAFEKLPATVVNRLKNDKKYFETVIIYHVVQGKYLSENFPLKPQLSTTAIEESAQTTLKLHVDKSQISTVQDAVISGPDKLALNGIIHIIDRVLLPPTRTLNDILKEKKDLRIFRKFLKNTNATLYNVLTDESGFHTIFAPSNRAMKRFFNKLGNRFSTDTDKKMNSILLRHFVSKPFFTTQLVEGKPKSLKTFEYKNNSFSNIHAQTLFDENERVRIVEYDSDVITPNMIATNGVIHIVDKVFSRMKL